MKLINFIRDWFYDLYQYILMILMMGIVGLILYTTITSMYQTDYNHIVSAGNKEAVITETREEEATEFELFFPENSSILDLSKILVDAGVITDQENFLNYLNENPMETDFPSGNFSFHKNMTYEEIVETFHHPEEIKETEDTEEIEEPIEE